MKLIRRTSFRIISLIIGFSFLCAGCTHLSEITEIPQATVSPVSNSFGDGGFLSESPCGPPCFYGITPGETTEEEAKVIIQDEVSLFKNCTSFDNTSIDGDKGITCEYCGFTFDENFVSSVGFRPNERIELGQALEKIGEPDHLIPFSTSLPEYPLEGRYILCFDKPRISIWLPEIEGSKYNISPLTIIESINYGTDEAYQSSACSMIYESVEWEGYGDYPIQWD